MASTDAPGPRALASGKQVNPDTSHSPCPLVQLRTRSTGAIVLEMSWVGHLRLPPRTLDDQGYSLPATPSELGCRLHNFRMEAGTPARYLAPEFAPGQLREMRIFDPNHCSCLRYEGRHLLPHGWRLDDEHDDNPSSCLGHPENCLMALRDLLREDGKGARGVGEGHMVSTQTGKYPVWENETRITAETCADKAETCLRLRYNRIIGIRPTFDVNWGGTARVSWAWCQAMDPDSYGLTDDEDSLGILWCRQKGCRNYYRYLRPSFFPLEDTHRTCYGWESCR